jgi:hypothetical protein
MGLAPACGRATSTAPYRSGRGIYAGRVWTNCYRLCSAHAAFGGYKKSGIGREICKMMLDHHQQNEEHACELSGSFKAGIRHYFASMRCGSLSY